MAKKPEPEIDDELYNDIYAKEYTGPPGSTSNNAQERVNSNKRPQPSANANGESDEEDEPRDPNAVPTDFISREAKVWMAKSKATERNWKKRKEEEMICKICGESGHFTQGCPSTLGANRKSADFFERVPARDKHVKALFSEKVIHKIEKDVGCNLKMEEKFLIVSAKDRLCLKKGVDAVHKVIEEDKGKKKGPSSHLTVSRSPNGSPVASPMRRFESQRPNPSPRNASQFQPKVFNQERIVEDHLREDLQQLSRGSPQARAYGNDGAKGRASHSKSPSRPSFGGDAYGSYDSRPQNIGVLHKTDSWDIERRGGDVHSGRKIDFASYPQTLEEIELEFKREAMDFGRIRDKEEDDENYKHRESIRELRETYMKKLAILRGMQAKQWEEFLQLDIQRRQRARQNMSSSSFNTYNHPSYSEYDRSSGNPHYTGSNMPSESRNRYPLSMENYSSSRPHDTYGEFQRQRHEDYGKTYNRY
eukprot:TRINITY_DN4785_c0_g1_i1.p1 TRINITY_DN4785_c0_g1~~TRINITY_DN4785_c0_g1_i1.p1  ORF type:complete len:476 (+),score=96.60 TRINITY_DN4785_c0_g1_i1:169-1596(+)